MGTNSSTDILTQKAEIKLTGFLVEQDIPADLSPADHQCISQGMFYSKTIQYYSSAKTKTFCILN